MVHFGGSPRVVPCAASLCIIRFCPHVGSSPHVHILSPCGLCVMFRKLGVAMGRLLLSRRGRIFSSRWRRLLVPCRCRFCSRVGFSRSFARCGRRVRRIGPCLGHLDELRKHALEQRCVDARRRQGRPWQERNPCTAGLHLPLRKKKDTQCKRALSHFPSIECDVR